MGAVAHQIYPVAIALILSLILSLILNYAYVFSGALSNNIRL
jgi:hypothetical protein